MDEEKIPFKENLKELILNNNKKVFKEEKGLAENDLDKDIEKANSDFKNGFNNLNSKATKELDNYTNSVNNHAEALSRDSQNTKNATENTEELVKQAENAGKKLPSTTQGIMSATQAMMSFTTICNSFKSM